MFTTAFQAAAAERCRYHACSPSGCSRLAAGAAQDPTDVPERWTSRTASGLHDAAGAVVCLVNAERSSRGLRPLRARRRPREAARRHSADMARRNYFAHKSPGGDDRRRPRPRRRLRRPGDGWRVGREPRLGHRQPRRRRTALVDEWLASPAHKRIMLRELLPRVRRRRRRRRAEADRRPARRDLHAEPRRDPLRITRPCARMEG